VADEQKDEIEVPTCIGMMFAENYIISEGDKVLSLIRIVDHVLMPPPPDGFQTGEGLSMGSLKLVVMLRAKKAKGDFIFAIVCHGPNEHHEPIGLFPTKFAPYDEVDAADSSAKNLTTEFTLSWDGEGLYWYELHLNGKIIAKTRLLVTINHKLPPFTRSS
jgi:hypothetical protein